MGANEETTRVGEQVPSWVAQELVAALPDGILITDGDGRITFANSRLAALAGYPELELLGLPVEILIPERRRDAHQQHRTTFGAQPRTRPMGTGLETVLRQRDGAELAVDIALRPVSIDGRDHVVAAVRDATDRKQLERQTTRQQRRLDVAAERERIARELFDDIVTALFALGLDLQAATFAEDATLRTRVDQAVEDLDKLIVKLRNQVLRLRAGSPDPTGD